MSKRVLLFVLASVLMPFCISAQDYAVKGSVWDFDTAEPICSVAVSVYQITGNDTTFVVWVNASVPSAREDCLVLKKVDS